MHFITYSSIPFGILLYTFFTYYNIDIQAGDRCIVTRVDRDGITPIRTYQGLVGESNLYRGHKEILLHNVEYITEGNL